MSQDLSEKILEYLSYHESVGTLELAKIFEEDHQKIVGALKSIEAAGDFVNVENKTDHFWELTEEGQLVVQNGSHEACIYKSIPENGILQTDLMQKIPNGKIGFSKAMSSGWITVDKSTGKPIVKKKVESITDIVRLHLKSICSGYDSEIPDKIKAEYKKRKLIQEVVLKSFFLTKGREFSTKITKLETDLTSEMLQTGSWKNLKFKDYNLRAKGAVLECGFLHPLLQVKSEFRQIFLEMGFTEMPTNNFVENSFWNFDALFQPQQHPARDAHDTFFISDPKESHEFPMDYLRNVERVHKFGGYGSQGYKYDWKISEAQKNLLRTHTTANSARNLYKMAGAGFRPAKYFSIDRVFRNETLDATHLAEFHQVEGVIIDRNLTLANLIAILNEFFFKLGITELEFKPAYNPYTEPSMEIFCFHKGLEKWIEIGNSGMFRPEMILPMGLPDDVRVLGWGLSLERPTMIKFGYNNIRDLVGPKVDLKMVQNAALCRLDK